MTINYSRGWNGTVISPGCIARVRKGGFGRAATVKVLHIDKLGFAVIEFVRVGRTRAGWNARSQTSLHVSWLEGAPRRFAVVAEDNFNSTFGREAVGMGESEAEAWLDASGLIESREGYRIAEITEESFRNIEAKRDPALWVEIKDIFPEKPLPA